VGTVKNDPIRPVVVLVLFLAIALAIRLLVRP
jgi:hypothetical protein